MTAHLRRWSLLAPAFATVLATMASATASAAPTPRVHFVHDGELLRSEARAITETCARLQKHLQAVCGEASADEAAAARAYLTGQVAGQASALPEAWKGASRVVVFQLLAPAGSKKGERVTRGWNSLVMLAPPSATPLWAERSDGSEGPWLNPEELEKLVRALLAIGAP